MWVHKNLMPFFVSKHSFWLWTLILAGLWPFEGSLYLLQTCISVPRPKEAPRVADCLSPQVVVWHPLTHDLFSSSGSLQLPYLSWDFRTFASWEHQVRGPVSVDTPWIYFCLEQCQATGIYDLLIPLPEFWATKRWLPLSVQQPEFCCSCLQSMLKHVYNSSF